MAGLKNLVLRRVSHCRVFKIWLIYIWVSSFDVVHGSSAFSNCPLFMIGKMTPKMQKKDLLKVKLQNQLLYLLMYPNVFVWFRSAVFARIEKVQPRHKYCVKVLPNRIGQSNKFFFCDAKVVCKKPNSRLHHCR